MATSKRPGAGPGSKKTNHTDLPTIELPPAGGKERSGARVLLPVDGIDFDNEKLRPGWQKIIDSQRKHLETDVLKISPPRAKFDPIAKAALDKLRTKLITDRSPNNAPGPGGLEKTVRAFITRKGIATEVKKVTDRLNARRFTDGRRAVLAATYDFLLSKLFKDQTDDELEELMKDDLGVVERIILDLEAKGGPVDVYANLIVKSVMKRNRIHPSNTLVELVSQQVRAAI